MKRKRKFGGPGFGALAVGSSPLKQIAIASPPPREPMTAEEREDARILRDKRRTRDELRAELAALQADLERREVALRRIQEVEATGGVDESLDEEELMYGP
jgi:hypothetical protein